MPDMTEDTEEERIIYDQLQLGQRATLNGIWTQDWMNIRDAFVRRIRSRKSPKVWLIRFSLLLQNMTHHMWKTRNEAIHNKEDSEMNKQRHEELDEAITDIYKDRPHFKLLPTCDEAFCKRGQVRVKKYRLRKKELWVSDAKRILEAYNESVRIIGSIS